MAADEKELEENETDVSVEEFAEKLNLEIICSGGGTMHMSTLNINRPGLHLAGYYEHFGEDRIQVLGEMETAYLLGLDERRRYDAVDKLFDREFPCVIISGGKQPCKEILECAQKHSKVVFGTKLHSTMLINELSIYLNELLAPRIVMHGVLLDLYGVEIGRASCRERV